MVELSSHYGDLLAFEWRQRRQRAESVNHDFAQLCSWDQRIRAYLDGLGIVGAASSEMAADRLHEPITEGELFALGSLAIASRDARLVQSCLSLVQAFPSFGQAFSAALEWADWEGVEFALHQWPREDPTRQAYVLQSIGCHGVRLDPCRVTAILGELSSSPQVQLSALLCGLTLGEPAWTDSAFELIHAEGADVRLAAAQALIVFGNADTLDVAMEELQRLASGSGRTALQATRELMSLGGPTAQELLEDLAADPQRSRQFLAAIGWSGQLRKVSVLAELLDDAAWGRAAASALCILTGSDPFGDGWIRPQQRAAFSKDPESDGLPPFDADAAQPWPDQGRFRDWWNVQPMRQCDAPCIAGRIRTVDSLLAVLRGGQLAVRAQAAWLLQVGTCGRRLAHASPAHRQQDQLHRMTEDYCHA